MDTLNFLQRVLPSVGVYCVLSLRGERRRQTFHSTIEELAQKLQEESNRGANAYYAVASYKDDSSRKQSNVEAHKLFAVDIDCGVGKPYATWKDGLLALLEFVKKSDLPKPMVVHSGNGLHVYWVLTEHIHTDVWRGVAEGLKACCIALGLEADPTVPADAARVLRAPGTVNNKGGHLVRVIIQAEPVPLAEVRSKLVTYITHVAAPKSDYKPSALAQAMSVQQEYPPAIGGVVASKCQQIQWAIKNPQEVSEPLWYNMIGVAAHCEEPETTALAWSEGHPGFSPRVTIQKLEHWKSSTTGPATCKKFEQERPAGCKGCKFLEKISTPAQLGIQYAEVQVAAKAEAIAAEVPLPRSYKRTAKGIVQTVDETDIDVSPFDLYPVGYGRDESLGYEVVRYHWLRPHMGWQELMMRQAYLTEGHREFATSLADQGVVLPNKKQTERFQSMLRHYMDELRSMKSMTNHYNSMGWKENNTQFLLGDTLLRRDTDGNVTEELVTMASSSTRVSESLYGTAGNREQWIQMTSILEKANLPAHQFALLVGMSSPLYAFTGLKGITISLWGKTGAGKTLAQLWQQSIWGDPEKLHFAAKFTQNALFSRMGLYCHLPMTIDETTLMQGNLDVGDFIYWVSQGRDKVRLMKTTEERDTKTWSCPTMVSTNKQMAAQLASSGLAMEAQMMRLLELQIPESTVFTKDTSVGAKLYRFVTENYGHVGKDLVRELLSVGDQGIRAMIDTATQDFEKTFGSRFSGPERYWAQVVILAYLAGRLATQLGLIKFNYESTIKWVLTQLHGNRKTVTENKLDCFDLISDYISENVGGTVTVTHTGTQASFDFNRLPRQEVTARIDLYRNKASEAPFNGIAYFERSRFRAWLMEKGYDYRNFLLELGMEKADATPTSKKLSMGKSTPIKLPQTYVVGISLTHPRLLSMLDDRDETVATLKAVV